MSHPMLNRLFAPAAITAASFVLSDFVTADPVPTAAVVRHAGLSTSGQMSFESSTHEVSIASDFPGGRIDELVEVNPARFDVVIRPEIEPINDSAWYAFKVAAADEREVEVTLRYDGGSHRYQPKISRDRRHWEPAEHLIVARHPAGREVTMRIPVGPKPTWVAGQELYGDREVDAWAKQLRSRDDVTGREIGRSVQDRPLRKLEIADPAADPRRVVFILSRQHPPEVTGTIGMMDFVNRLVSDDEVAKDYRENFRTVVIPVANPDGVAKGYWRANANGVDLNRDWLRFEQPETRAIRDEILRHRSGGTPYVFIDFHSTYEEVFYTPPRDTPLFPRGFTTRWVTSMNRSIDGFDMLRDDTHNAHRSTSKAWVARELGIQAITYEFGDETDRDQIKQIASVSATEFMRLLLETTDEPFAP